MKILFSLENPVTLAVVAPRDPYLFPSLQVVILMIFCVVGAFACITYLYGRQFTKDTRFLQKMLDSMDSVQESNFAPLDLEGRDDEFGQIASNLNSLYRHLELLIRQASASAVLGSTPAAISCSVKKQWRS